MAFNSIDRHRAKFANDFDRNDYDTRAQSRSGSNMTTLSALRRRVPDTAAEDFESSMDHWLKGAAPGRPGDAAPARGKQRRSALPQTRHGAAALGVAKGGDQSALRRGRESLVLPEREEREVAVKRIFDARAKGEKVLDLEGLGLKNLPEVIGDLPKIDTLNVNCNSLASLPDALARLGGLKNLNAALNNIKRLPSGLFGLYKLGHLDLSGNNIRDIRGIGELVSLTRLHLDFNRIESLPPELGRLGKLKCFSASMNLFSSVPPEMGDLRQLRRVNLSNTQVATLPVKWHPMIENLVQLDLSRTNFRGFHESESGNSPDDLKFPKKMQLLNISHTLVNTLPGSFGCLTFWGDANGNVLRTTKNSILSRNVKICVEQTNLPAELAREGRMVTNQPIQKLERVRHADKRRPSENQDNDVDSGSDEGEDLEFELEYIGAAGAPDRAHAERMRRRAEGNLPTGRAAKWAAECAEREFAEPWAEPAPQALAARPWGDLAAAPWPGLTRPTLAPFGQMPPWAVTGNQQPAPYGWGGPAAPVATPIPYPYLNQIQNPGQHPLAMGAGQFNPFGFNQLAAALPSMVNPSPYGNYAFTQANAMAPAFMPQTAAPSAAVNPNPIAAPDTQQDPYALGRASRDLSSWYAAQQPPAWSSLIAPQRPSWAPQMGLLERTGVQAVVDKIGSVTEKAAEAVMKSDWFKWQDG